MKIKVDGKECTSRKSDGGQHELVELNRKVRRLNNIPRNFTHYCSLCRMCFQLVKDASIPASPISIQAPAMPGTDDGEIYTKAFSTEIIVPTEAPENDSFRDEISAASNINEQLDKVGNDTMYNTRLAIVKGGKI